MGQVLHLFVICKHTCCEARYRRGQESVTDFPLPCVLRARYLVWFSTANLKQPGAGPHFRVRDGGHGRQSDERRFLPTISLQIDYLGSAKLGAWVQGEAQILRVTRNMLFGQGLITADGEPSVRFSGIFKLGPHFGDVSDTDPLGLR